MEFPKAKGVMVYATGRTETIDDPAGRFMIKVCTHCGSELYFDSSGTLAEDRRSVYESHPNADKFRAMARHRPDILDGLNGACVVYIQRPSMP